MIRSSKKRRKLARNLQGGKGMRIVDALALDRDLAGPRRRYRLLGLAFFSIFEEEKKTLLERGSRAEEKEDPLVQGKKKRLNSR